MDLCNISWRWLTPANCINVITSSVSHSTFHGTVYFLFTILSFFPARSNNTYHIFYSMIFEIHRYQPFNQRLFFFGCVDNSCTTVLILRILLFVLVIIICVLFYFHIFYRIVYISTWHIILFSMWSISTFRIIIICLVS